jgi:hypothetical protein
MEFHHDPIDDSPPCGRLFVCRTTDLTGNGRPDLIVGGLGSETLPVVGVEGLPLVGSLFRRLESDLFWYENPGWDRHVISPRSDLRPLGNALGDVTGNGRLDLFVAQGHDDRDVYWFEQPDDPREAWTQHLIGSPFEKYHDLAFGDVDGDGAPELVGASQGSEVLFYYDVPADPRREPWPEHCRHVVARATNVEGLEILDLDDDGRNELVAGTSIYRPAAAADPTPTTNGAAADGGRAAVADGWTRTEIVPGWDWTRIAAGDLDGDGDTELVFAEGDAPLLGDRMGRLGWFDPPEWTAHVLHEELYCPHTVQVTDFDGDGRPDIYVAEMGLGRDAADAEHLLFRNLGGGDFEATVVARGVPTHEARAVDVDGDGRVDVIGTSYAPDPHVDVWYNRPTSPDAGPDPHADRNDD